MEITATLHAATRKKWRDWLEGNHGCQTEIWLVSYRKATGHPSIPYSDAVEEALCFGWIDSTRKRFDQDQHLLKMSARGKQFGYSIEDFY